jgi:hypothetical protein
LSVVRFYLARRRGPKLGARKTRWRRPTSWLPQGWGRDCNWGQGRPGADGPLHDDHRADDVTPYYHMSCFSIIITLNSLRTDGDFCHRGRHTEIAQNLWDCLNLLTRPFIGKLFGISLVFLNFSQKTSFLLT